MNRRSTILCFREEPDKAGTANAAGVLPEEKDHSEHEEERVLRCKACSFRITSDKERFSKDGKHQHTFFNPAGIVYEIGCFKDAPGCLIYGPLSGEFAWFAGYSWQVVYCTSCLEHLGWYFSTAGSGFFGLRLNSLREG